MRIFFSGFASKRLLVFLFLLFLAGMVFAGPFTITSPTFKSDIPGVDIGILNSAAENAFNSLQNTINGSLPDNFSNFARGFANASVFSSDGASQRGYEGYNSFSFTTGLTLAFQVPQLTKIMNVMNNGGEGIEPDFIKNIVNIPFGIDGKLTAQLGINTSKFLLKDFYLGFKFSMFNTGWAIPSDFFYFETMSVGINASYQLISQKRLLADLLVWRGLNLETGFTWQKTTSRLSTPALSEIDDVIGELRNIPVTIPLPAPIGDYDINMQIDGSLHLNFDTYTYIIPIEAMTSLRVLGFLNVALGAGCDIAFGLSSIKAYGSLFVSNNPDLPVGITMDKKPSLTLDLPGTSSPAFFNPKIMGAMGFNFGPVIIDIPVTYYFVDNGYSLGITLGLTF